MKCIDLFSGVGGMSLGFEQAGLDTVLAVEKEALIAEGYKKNFVRTEVIVSGVEDLNIEETFAPLKDTGIDVVFGGPPCQGFSQKGKRLHITDDRNYLFRYFVETVNFIRPAFFVIENVPNILTAAKGAFYKEIYETFSDLGYQINAKVLDASMYGVPQTRKRAFIVGNLPGHTFSFPKESEKKVTVADAISDLPRLKSGEGQEKFNYFCSPKSDYQERARQKSIGIFNHQATNHSPLALKRLALIPHEGGGKESLPKEHLTKSVYSGTWSRLRSDMPARTITTRFDTPSSGQFTLPDQDRCLTVREAARLQSFPDWFQFTGTKSNQMLQVGNAVPPLLAEKIGRSILKGYAD